MSLAQLKDREFKNFIKKEFNSVCLVNNKYYSDALIKGSNRTVLLEYENSSRGNAFKFGQNI